MNGYLSIGKKYPMRAETTCAITVCQTISLRLNLCESLKICFILSPYKNVYELL